MANGGKLLIGVIGLNLIAGAIALVLLWKPKEEPPPPQATSFPVTVAVVPANAVVRIDGQARDVSKEVLLEPGTHQIAASLDGYESAETRIFVSNAGGTPPVELRLNPLTLSVQFFAKLPGATLLFDGGQVQPGTDGYFVVPDVAAGEHSIEFRAGPVEAKLKFTAAPPAAPTLVGPPVAKNALLVTASYAGDGNTVVASSGGPATVRFTQAGEAAAAAGAAPIESGPVDATRTAPVTLSAAEWQVAIVERGRPNSVNALQTGKAPVLAVFLRTDLGQVDVSVEPAAAQVTLDRQGRNVPSWRGRVPGKVYFANLEAGEYRLKVSQDGFDPQEKLIAVAKGGHPVESVRLVEKPKKAVIEISGLPAGADGAVFLGSEQIGAVSGGSFQYTQANPGRSAIRLQVRNFDTDPVNAQLNAGETVRLTFDSFKPRKRLGRLDGQIAPASATVVLTDDKGVSQTKKVSELGQLGLEFGKEYTLRIEAQGFRPATVNGILVRDVGNERTFHLGARRLEEIPKPKAAPAPPPPPKAASLPGWDDSNVWVPGADGFRQYRKGSPIAFDAPGGTVIIDAKVGRSLKWQANFMDGRNHVYVEMRKDRLIRRRVVNGRKEDERNILLPGGSNEMRRVRIVMSGETITHSLWDGSAWQELDELRGNDLGKGKFVLSDDNRPALREFQYTR
jgi:hypothetical protein